MVYLLHFDRPISPNHTSQHYLGYAANERSFKARIAHHKAGTSHARLLEVAKERGIGFEVARTWPEGDRGLERQLKNRKNAKRLCPCCGAKI